MKAFKTGLTVALTLIAFYYAYNEDLLRACWFYLVANLPLNLGVEDNHLPEGRNND